MILFEYKGVKITGQSRDEVELLTAELKKQIDQVHYHRKALDVAFQLMDDEQVGRWNYFMELPDNEFADWDIVTWEENYEDKMGERLSNT